MKKVIRNIVNNQDCYNYLIKYLPLLLDIPSKNLHNKQLIRKYKPSIKTFEGRHVCGASSYLLYYYIKSRYPIEIKFMLSTFGYGKYLEDHLYLQADNFIVDPTYKQFLVSENETDEYLKFVFNDCPFIFVSNDIKDLYKNKHSDMTNLDDNLIFWEKSKDVTSQYLNKDLNKIINIDTLEKKQTLDSFIRFYVK